MNDHVRKIRNQCTDWEKVLKTTYLTTDSYLEYIKNKKYSTVKKQIIYLRHKDTFHQTGHTGDREVHTMHYCWTINKKELLMIHAPIWMALKDIMLSGGGGVNMKSYFLWNFIYITFSK